MQLADVYDYYFVSQLSTHTCVWNATVNVVYDVLLVVKVYTVFITDLLLLQYLHASGFVDGNVQLHVVYIVFIPIND